MERPRQTQQRIDGTWRDELRATMALAWPLILANLRSR